jgi:hypothetical protein
VALFGEFLTAIGVCGLIDHELPTPGSAAGYSPSAHVLPLSGSIQTDDRSKRSMNPSVLGPPPCTLGGVRSLPRRWGRFSVNFQHNATLDARFNLKR